MELEEFIKQLKNLLWAEVENCNYGKNKKLIFKSMNLFEPTYYVVKYYGHELYFVDSIKPYKTLNAARNEARKES